MSFIYDVALSFAGEDREYVDKVANALRDLRVSVFYDKFEEVNLWGKDLYGYLSDIYFKKCKYTVIFISEHYSKKLWTNHERKNAQARAFNESGEYILPARFDDSDVPGLLPTIGYIDLRMKAPYEFAGIIKQKVMEPDNSFLKLIDYFPKDSQRIRTEEVKNIFLKFNNPIDRDTQVYIKNYYIQANSICQWNTCGWIEFAEGDTLLKWHVHEQLLSDSYCYGPLEFDYPRFEIQIGSKDSDWKVKDVHGNEFPYYMIPVKIIE